MNSVVATQTFLLGTYLANQMHIPPTAQEKKKNSTGSFSPFPFFLLPHNDKYITTNKKEKKKKIHASIWSHAHTDY